jgi:DNA-binding transcriptional LysR family regulator
MTADLSKLDLVLARHFLVLAEERSFTGAARRLHLTQSALSKQVRRLERRLGATLVDRDCRPLRLTADGAEVLRRSQELLARVTPAPGPTRAAGLVPAPGLTPAVAGPRTGWRARPWSGSRRSPGPGSPAAATPAHPARRPGP